MIFLITMLCFIIFLFLVFILVLVSLRFTTDYSIEELEKKLSQQEKLIEIMNKKLDENMKEMKQLKGHDYHMPTPEEVDEYIEDLDKENENESMG